MLVGMLREAERLELSLLKIKAHPESAPHGEPAL